MQEFVRFAAKHKVKNISFTPLMVEGNAREHSIQQPKTDEFVRHYSSALALAKQLDVHVSHYVNALICKDLVSNEFMPPLYWFPDGSLALVNRYSSPQQEGASDIIVGQYNFKKNQFEINQDKIKAMNDNFLQNRKKH